MAVDANVVIFERVKEELKLGKTVRSSVESGFNRALSAVIDSNVTTIISATVILWWLGTEQLGIWYDIAYGCYRINVLGYICN